jgi:glycerol kinase
VPVLLALDQGTTSSRAIAFDHHGKILGLGQRRFRQHYPKPGWVEHDPEEIVRTTRAAAREALRKADVNPSSVAAAGIANQRETIVLWDRQTGQAVAPAIVWQDRRTAGHCAELREAGHEPEITKRTGLLVDPYFSATKLRWLLESDRRLRRRAQRGDLAAGTIDSWLAFRLTGEHITDESNASRTLLYNLREHRWDPWLLDLFEIPDTVLPAVRDTSAEYGQIHSSFLGARVPLASLIGDQQAATFGQGCLRPGQVKSTYGTGAFLVTPTGDRVVAPGHGLLSTVLWRLEGRTTYGVEGSVFIAGALVEWLVEGLGLASGADELQSLAESVGDTNGLVIVPALAGLGAPDWDPAARGLIIGATRGTTRAHLARAALEAIAATCADVVEAMRSAIDSPIRELRVDGGASANETLMRMQADRAGVTVRRPKVHETTALGAALLAGLAIGVWSSPQKAVGVWQESFSAKGSWSAKRRASAQREWRRAVERSKGWAQQA